MRQRSDLQKLRPSFRAATAALVLVLAVIIPGVPAGAQSIDEVVAELDQTGRFSEYPINGELDASIGRANGNGIAFAWIDNDGQEAAEQFANEFLNGLAARSSQYRTIVVLANDSAYVESLGVGAPEAGAAALGQFAAGANAAALDTVTATMTGASDPTATTTAGSTNSTAGSGGSDSTSSSSSGGSGIGGILLIGFLALLGFFALRWFLGRSKANKQEQADIADDKAEIQEQLKNNADLVIDLGDRVIASNNRELIASYEQASSQYQEVSIGLKDATTIEEIDRLDELIDDAEFRFLTIEAKLEGRPAPVRPLNEDDDPMPPAPTGQRPPGPGGLDQRSGPALGPNESVLGGDRTSSRRSGSPSRPPTRSSRKSGGMGGMGGMLGGVLGSILMGQMNRRTSRRTQQRSSRRASSDRSAMGGSVLRGGSGVSGLGGGVLRRDGGSSRPSNVERGRSSSRRSGGGGGFGNRRSGGGGGFGG